MVVFLQQRCKSALLLTYIIVLSSRPDSKSCLLLTYIIVVSSGQESKSGLLSTCIVVLCFIVATAYLVVVIVLRCSTSVEVAWAAMVMCCLLECVRRFLLLRVCESFAGADGAGPFVRRPCAGFCRTVGRSALCICALRNTQGCLALHCLACAVCGCGHAVYAKFGKAWLGWGIVDTLSVSISSDDCD